MEVVLVTSVGVIVPKYRGLMDLTFGDQDLVKVSNCFGQSGIEWVFEYVATHVEWNDAVFQRLWRLLQFGRTNFSSLKVKDDELTTDPRIRSWREQILGDGAQERGSLFSLPPT